MGIRVRALRVGVYGHYREEGEEFVIAKKEDLGSWMVPVSQLPKRKGDPDNQEVDDLLP